MCSEKPTLAAVILICLTIFVLSLPPVSLAQDITLVPSLNLTGQYDDNVTFRRNNKDDDYVGIVSPGFTLDYASELLNFKTSAIIDVLRYYDNSDLNTENQRYTLNGGYRFAERWNASGNFSFIKDETLDSERDETGIVYRREDRKPHRGAFRLCYGCFFRPFF